MTAIVYFAEMLVASVLAIVLLAISRLPMSRRWRHWMDPWRNMSFIALCCTIARHENMGCIMPNPTARSSQFCKYGFVSLVYLIAGGASLRAR
jgi:hypothetical protein